MAITIKRRGNSACIPISESLLKALRADIGDTVEVHMIDAGLLIRPAQARPYSLGELLSRCTPQSLHLDTEDIAWLHDAHKGSEVGGAK